MLLKYGENNAFNCSDVKIFYITSDSFIYKS